MTELKRNHNKQRNPHGIKPKTPIITQEEIDRIPCNATDPKIIEDRIMDSNIPKSEAEWWAKREIEKLREIQPKGIIIGNPTIKKLRKGETVTFPLTNPNICLIPDDELFNKAIKKKNMKRDLK